MLQNAVSELLRENQLGGDLRPPRSHTQIRVKLHILTYSLYDLTSNNLTDLMLLITFFVLILSHRNWSRTARYIN